jgi:hypothetical protein
LAVWCRFCRRRAPGFVGVHHKVTRDEAKKWFIDTYEGIIIKKKKVEK